MQVSIEIQGQQIKVNSHYCETDIEVFLDFDAFIGKVAITDLVPVKEFINLSSTQKIL